MSGVPPRRLLSWRWLVPGLLALALVVFAVKRIFFWGPAPIGPPQVDLSGVDPAVRRAVETEMQNVRAAPDSAEAWGTLGMVLAGHVFAGQARSCFIRAEQLDPADARWPYQRGLIDLATDPPAALPSIRRAVELGGDRKLGPRLRLAELCLRLGRNDEAREHFEALLRRAPGHPRAYLGLARLHFQAGELDRSREKLVAALAHPATRKPALTLSAEIHQRQGHPKKARQDLAAALELPREPVWPDEYIEEGLKHQVGESVRLKRAERLLGQGHPAEAMVLIRDIVRDYPRSTRAWILLGWIQVRRGELAQAELSLQTALELDPSSVRVLLFLGDIRYERKDRRAAMDFFRRAIQRKPDSFQGHFNLGRCLKKEGERKAAITAFRDALRCRPLSAPAHAQLGELFLKDNRKEDALAHLEQAVDLNPQDAGSRKLLEELRGKVGSKKK